VLTIALAGGGEISARVDDTTEIECPAAASASDDHGGGEGEGAGHGGQGGDDPAGDDHGGHSGDDPAGEDHDHHAGCGTDALTQGREVREADIRVRDGAATYREIELGAAE
jgi:hypothetical protein